MSGPGGYPTAPSAPPDPYQQWQQQSPSYARPSHSQSFSSGLPYQPSPSFGQSTGPYSGPPSSAPYASAPPTGPYYGQGQRPGAYPQYAYGQQSQQYGQFASSRGQFPPDTDPEIVRQFQMADQDASGTIDDRELQRILSVRQPFSLRTVHLMLHLFSPHTSFRIGPAEFATLWRSLKQWRGVFEKFDRDYSGQIDSAELREALLSLGYAVSPAILKALLLKYGSSGQGQALEYDKFVECGLIVKGLTDKFKEKDPQFTGSATLNYETFMLMVLPFIGA